MAVSKIIILWYKVAVQKVLKFWLYLSQYLHYHAHWRHRVILLDHFIPYLVYPVGNSIYQDENMFSITRLHLKSRPLDVHAPKFQWKLKGTSIPLSNVGNHHRKKVSHGPLFQNLDKKKLWSQNWGPGIHFRYTKFEMHNSFSIPTFENTFLFGHQLWNHFFAVSYFSESV